MTDTDIKADCIRVISKWLNEETDYTPKREIASLLFHIEQLENNLETEHLRLAACGIAALGYFDACNEEYKSASLADVLSLHENLVRLEKENTQQRKDLETLHEWQVLSIKDTQDLYVEINQLKGLLTEANKCFGWNEPYLDLKERIKTTLESK